MRWVSAAELSLLPRTGTGTPTSGQGQQEQAACSAGAVTSVPFLLQVDVRGNEVPEQPALVPKGLQE